MVPVYAFVRMHKARLGGAKGNEEKKIPGRLQPVPAHADAGFGGSLAGGGAYWLFTLGLIGTGMLGVPVLAGSCAYAVAEAKAWHGSLEAPPRLAPKFYAVLAVAMVLGMGLDYAGVDAVAMLFWAAVVNGILAPPLVLLVVLLTSDPRVMGDRTNPPVLRWLGWLAAILMAAATIAMLVAAVSG